MDTGKNVALDTEPKNGAYTSGYGAQPQSSSYPQPVGGSTYPPSGYPPPQNHASYPPPQQNGAYPAHHQQQQQQQPLYTAQPPPPPAPYSPYTAPPGSGGYPAQQYAATYSPNAPPVMMGGAATVLDTPPNVIVGDASDSCLIQHRNSLLMVIACVAAIGAVIAVINLIVKFNVLTLVGGIIALGLALGCAFFCHDVVIEFNKGSNAFRLMHRRLLFTLCDQRDIKIDVPFSQLGEPYAESSGPTGNGAALATIWLPIQAHPNVKLSAHQYHNEVDLQRDLMAWRVYVNRFRGPASVGAAIINAVHGAAAGLTSAIRI